MPQSKEDFFRCIYSDNDIRVAGKRDLEGDLKLWERNEKLLDEEAALIKKYAGNSGLPVVFIVGVPRSGTTLLTQLMASCLDIGYIPNAVASYWMTPVYGMKKYLEDFGGFQHNNTYDSFLGNTGGPHDPSEFGWFWQYHLGNDGCDELEPSDRLKTAYRQIQTSINALCNQLSSAIFIKNTVYLNFIIDQINQIFDNARFIRMKRDDLFVAQSIYQSRIKRYGNKDRWWSIRPKGWQSAIRWPAEKQIAWQVSRTSSTISTALNNANCPWIEIQYEDLVDNPTKHIEQVSAFTGCKQINDCPKLESSNIWRINKELSDVFIKYLNETD